MNEARGSHKNIVVIFAGGNGARMGSPTGPKQFMEVCEKPIIIYTLEHFEKLPEIDAIYISCIKEGIPQLKGLVDKFSINKVTDIVPGGGSALESILNGLTAAVNDKRNDAETVALIHDGVRPIINNKLIRDNIESARQFGSAISSIPAYETIAESEDDAKTISMITDRKKSYVLQAPQSFRLGEVQQEYKKSLADGSMENFVDSAQLMDHYGHKLHMIDGFRGNVKITVPLDFTYFKFLVESGEFVNVTGESI